MNLDALVGREFVEGGDVSDRQVDDVDPVAHARPVRSLPVIPENDQVRPAADRNWIFHENLRPFDKSRVIAWSKNVIFLKTNDVEF